MSKYWYGMVCYICGMIVGTPSNWRVWLPLAVIFAIANSFLLNKVTDERY